MTDKLAIFVEGQTEQVLVEALIYEIAGRHKVHIDTLRGHGGRQYPRQFVELNATGPDPKKRYYVIIYDSATDGRVLSDIRDHYERLTEEGFREVIGFHDLYPIPRENEAEVRKDFADLSPQGTVPVTLSLAVMEVEAWFIAEHTHTSSGLATV